MVAPAAWKEKNLDYEIETGDDRLTGVVKDVQAWKEKNLDYEIETYRRSWVVVSLKSTWKEKNLDYEIETFISHRCRPVALPWKEKNLDYEIETRLP